MTARSKARPPSVDATCSHEACKSRGTYTLTGRCANCGTESIEGTFTVTHEARDSTLGGACPVCGCNSIYWKRGDR